MNARVPIGLAEPTSVLIAALGGQGGGVLTGWIVHAARAQGLAVQATSSPGVSQRTGATTYYVEMADAPRPGQRAPVLGLAPIPGHVDVMVCAELLEAARMVERGMSTPARTFVVASTHRVYTTREKMSGEDGRFDTDRIVDATRALSRRAVLFDMEELRLRHRAAISAVLFGALAGSGAVPLTRGACEEAIRAAGIGVETSLAAFKDAFARASHEDEGSRIESPAPSQPTRASPPGSLAARIEALPVRVAEMAGEGVVQLAEWQDGDYALRYLARVERIAQAAAGGGARAEEAARETARFLALWMAYDDLIRVASAKSRAARFARIRREAGAREGEVVRVYDFFRPGALEVAAILPRPLGAWLERRALRARTKGPAGHSLKLHTTSVTGTLAMRMLAALRPLRPYSLRFAREQQAIDEWLGLVERALLVANGGGVQAALGLARLPRLVKGYGDTHAGGLARFRSLVEAYHQAGGPASAAGVAALEAGAGEQSACGSPAAASAPVPQANGRPVVWLAQR